MPEAHIDLTDGVSLISGERETYLMIRRFLTHTLKQAGINNVAEYGASPLMQYQHDGTFSSSDEAIREQILGYTDSHGVFKRDTLVEKLRAFWRDESQE